MCLAASSVFLFTGKGPSCRDVRSMIRLSVTLTPITWVIRKLFNV